MGEILIVISLLASLKWLFEEALHSSWLTRGIHVTLYITAIIGIHTLTMESSLPLLEKALYTPESLENISLLVIIDLLYVVYLCTGRKREDKQSFYSTQLTPNARQRFWQGFRTVLSSLPPLLFFPTLYFIRLKLFYVLPGYSFVGISVGLALVVSIISLFAPQLCRFLTLQEETCKELSILLSLSLFLIIVAAGAIHPDSQVQGQGENINWLEVALLLGAVFIMSLLGYLGHRYYIYRKTKSIKSLQ